MSRDRRIGPRHDDQIEGKLEDHWRGGGPYDGAGQRDLPAPTPREVENHEESRRRIDERADAHAGRNECRISLLDLQSIDERGDDDVADRQQPYRDHEPGHGASWPRDPERDAQ